MIKRDNDKPRLFVLDTNVLMHDPTSIFRFHEHDIYLPMAVLEELDQGKKGSSEVARNVRQVSRFLDELMSGADQEEIEAGLPIAPFTRNGGPHAIKAGGRLFFQTAPQWRCSAACHDGPRRNHWPPVADSTQPVA